MDDDMVYGLSSAVCFTGVVVRVESVRSHQAESERQVNGLFESMLAETFNA